jgi:hypothetical protein
MRDPHAYSDGCPGAGTLSRTVYRYRFSAPGYRNNQEGMIPLFFIAAKEQKSLIIFYPGRCTADPDKVGEIVKCAGVVQL